MGYGAYVWCNCYKEGKTEPYPFAPEFIFPDDPFDPTQWPGMGTKARKWLETACDHPQFRFVDKWISTTQTMIAFKKVIRMEEKFPGLLAHLPPDTYDGRISSVEAKLFLDDLERFENLDTMDKIASFQYLIQAVKAVCKASIETGNPIIWC